MALNDEEFRKRVSEIRKKVNSLTKLVNKCDCNAFTPIFKEIGKMWKVTMREDVATPKLPHTAINRVAMMSSVRVKLDWQRTMAMAKCLQPVIKNP